MIQAGQSIDCWAVELGRAAASAFRVGRIVEDYQAVGACTTVASAFQTERIVEGRVAEDMVARHMAAAFQAGHIVAEDRIAEGTSRVAESTSRVAADTPLVAERTSRVVERKAAHMVVGSERRQLLVDALMPRPHCFQCKQSAC